MSGTIIPQAVQTFVDINGKPYAGGSVYMYIPNTTTFKNTYQDPGQTILNTNPIILNGSGQAIIWGTGSYRQILEDQFGNLIWDQVTEDTTSGLLGNLTDQKFVAGVDYTPGTTTTLTLSVIPGSLTNLWIYFDGVYQSDDTVASLTNTTLVFNSPIPIGVQEVNIKIGTTVAIGVPAAGSVTDSSISTASILYRHAYSWVDSKDYGATGNGTTNDSGALLTANNAALSTNKPLVLSVGNYLIGTNTTFTANLYVFPGAKFTVAAGVTLAFTGVLDAPHSQQIFDTSAVGATVTLNPANTAVAFPEWWGAQPNNASFDCSTAINACIVAASVTELQPATYYVNNTVKIMTANRTLRGYNPGAQSLGVAGGSQLAMQSPTADVIFVGLASDPGSDVLLLPGTIIKDIGTYRTVAVTPPASGNEINGSASGVRINYTIQSIFENIYTVNNSIGFNLINVDDAKFFRCSAGRTQDGNSPTNDIFWGYSLDGTTTYGMRSVYLLQCNTFAGVAAGTTMGVRVIGSFEDVHILDCEFNQLDYGIMADGTGGSQFVNIDNVISSCIMDQIKVVGVFIQNQGVSHSIKVSGNYVLVAVGATAAYYFYNNILGTTTIVGNEGFAFGGTMANGMLITACDNVSSNSNNFIDFFTAIGLTTATNCHVADNLYLSRADVAGVPAINLVTSCVACVIDCNVNGNAPNWTSGVAIDASCVRNEIRCTGINSQGIGLGSINKLLYNGTPVTVTGAFGTNNLAQGVMA